MDNMAFPQPLTSAQALQSILKKSLEYIGTYQKMLFKFKK